MPQHQNPATRTAPIRALEQLLDRERRRLGASCCTFYVRDPYWANEFRLLCMPGVRFPEPMHGWLFNVGARKLLAEGESEVYFRDVRPATLSEEESLAASRSAHSRLFSDFAGREKVKSFARLFHASQSGVVDAVLFVNFASNRSFDDSLKGKIRRIFKNALVHLADVNDELRRRDAGHLAESIRILQPALALARSFDETGSEGEDLKGQFKKLLEASLRALRVDEEEGVGTIHLYEPAAGLLRLAAFVGKAPNISKGGVQNVLSGEGIIAWVALKRKALLIDSVKQSEFGHLRVKINEEIRSEMAVPMIADGELVGVLNLECRRESAFDPASVRSVWYAANSAAVAFQLAKSSSTTRRFLSICEAATKDGIGTVDSDGDVRRDESSLGHALSDVADVLRGTLLGASCDIWHFNSFLGRFDAAGATYPAFVPALRRDGWTRYVWELGRPVWISNIRSETEFDKRCWEDGWVNEGQKLADSPSRLNKKVLEGGVVCDLGFPIETSSGCVGVAWIKYKRPTQPPDRKRMAEAFSVVSQAGLVLELVQRQVERPDKAQLIRVSEKLRPYSSSGPLFFGDLPLEGYVAHRPFHAYACGDFHAISSIDKSVAGLLIGDGEGKAVSGLLNALPLITGFEVFGRNSASSRHVIDRLRSVSRKLGLGGTALYCTFTLINDRSVRQSHLWLSMALAAHERPLLIRQSHHVKAEFIPEDGSPAIGTALGYDLDSPQAEYLLEMHPGDLLIAYTDGVTEALGRSDPLRGRNKLSGVVLGCDYQNCQELAESVMVAAETANPLLDDATVCVVRHTDT